MKGKKEKDKKESSFDVFLALENAGVPLRCPICNRIIDSEWLEDFIILEDPPRAYHMDCYKKAFPTEYKKFHDIEEEEIAALSCGL